MRRVIDLLSADLRTLRPGRASAELINQLPVEVYGQRMTIQQLAGISSNEQGQLIVQPWDRANLVEIERVIRASQLEFSVVNEGTQLRLTLPPLSLERRQDLVKVVSQKGEAARIQLRQIRTDALQRASREKINGQIREDDLARFTKELNELIDEFNNLIKELIDSKERELLSG